MSPSTAIDGSRPLVGEPQSISLDTLIDERPIGSLQWRVIALCALSTFLDGYDVQALGLAIPRMAAFYDVPSTAFGPAISASLIGMTLGAICISPLADKFGRRPMLIFCMLLIGLTTLGTMRASGITEIASWRFLTGLGLGATVPVAVAMTAEYAPSRSRTSIVALMAAFGGLGSFVAGYIAPLAEHWWTWRGIFGIGAALPLATAAILWFAFPESLRFLLRRSPGDQSVRRQVDRLAGGRPVTIIAATPAPGDHAAGVKALFAKQLWMRTTLLWSLLWLNMFGTYSLISWLPTLLERAGWSIASAQRATGLFALSGIAGGLLLATLVDRNRAVPSLVTSYLLTAAVLSLFVLLPDQKSLWPILLPLVGAGVIGSQVAIGSLAASFYPLEIRSTGLGWCGGIGRIGSIVGPMVLAALMVAGLSSAAVLSILLSPMLLCAILVTLLPRALAKQ